MSDSPLRTASSIWTDDQREMAMKKLLAIGLACCLPTGLAAEDPAESETSLGTVSVLVIEESAPLAKDVMCTRGAGDKSGSGADPGMRGGSCQGRSMYTRRTQPSGSRLHSNSTSSSPAPCTWGSG